MKPGFFFLVAKYGGRTFGWWLVANTPTRGSPSVFCSQKKRTLNQATTPMRDAQTSTYSFLHATILRLVLFSSWD
jgi:hypothetical protein